jgi:hypothetical protein
MFGAMVAATAAAPTVLMAPRRVRDFWAELEDILRTTFRRRNVESRIIELRGERNQPGRFG